MRQRVKEYCIEILCEILFSVSVESPLSMPGDCVLFMDSAAFLQLKIVLPGAQCFKPLHSFREGAIPFFFFFFFYSKQLKGNKKEN